MSSLGLLSSTQGRPKGTKLARDWVVLELDYNRKESQKEVGNEKVKQNGGGSVWESNPPKTLLMPPDGFEVREAHRDSSAP